MKNLITSFIKEEDGLATLEIAIICAVLIALAIVFRKQLTAMWDKIKDNFNGDDLQQEELEAKEIN